MTIQVKEILYESRQPIAFNLRLEWSRLYFSRLSFLTPANILIKNYRMKIISNYYLADDIDHD